MSDVAFVVLVTVCSSVGVTPVSARSGSDGVPFFHVGKVKIFDRLSRLTSVRARAIPDGATDGNRDAHKRGCAIDDYGDRGARRGRCGAPA